MVTINDFYILDEEQAKRFIEFVSEPLPEYHCGECKFHGIYSPLFFGFAWFICKKKRGKQRRRRVPLNSPACEKFERTSPENVCEYKVR